ncbi:MAG TPA: DegT/DnrJ/EryC1/StrS aminotransferase family protein [Methylocella sp.]|nr:DegT/DnrJ/EryC1/StrS aminotransferase family protein [Methylocella sp.]
MPIRIPVYQPDLSGNERAYVEECLNSNWISSKGKFVAAFEQGFAKYIGVAFAAAVCNGTTALHLALLALGLGEGDEVIVPALTYIAPANAVTYTGARPVFVDSRREDWQMDPADIVRKLTPRTRAIMAVHLYGHPCEMDEILEIARRHGLFVIEDAAEAIGSKYHGRHVGGFGDISVFSFYGNKTITTGEGGMVVTQDPTLYDRAKHLKGQGLAAHREYWHDVVGYNYRMTNICAAIGLAQLERCDETLRRKRRLAELFGKYLAGVPVKIHRESPNVTHSYWMISILVPSLRDRDPLREALARSGIETRPVFFPVHTMPMYSSRFQRHPVAEDIGWRGINLPSWPGLKESDVEEICAIIAGYFGKTH